VNVRREHQGPPQALVSNHGSCGAQFDESVLLTRSPEKSLSDLEVDVARRTPLESSVEISIRHDGLLQTSSSLALPVGPYLLYKLSNQVGIDLESQILNEWQNHVPSHKPGASSRYETRTIGAHVI